MKITIETDSSYECSLTVDGVTAKYGLRGGCWQWLDDNGPDATPNTIGGLVMMKVVDMIPDLLQGWMPEYDNPATDSCFETWEKLPEDVADDLYDRLAI